MYNIPVNRLSPKEVIKIVKEGITKGGKYMSSYVLGFQDIDKTKIMGIRSGGVDPQEWENTPHYDELLPLRRRDGARFGTLSPPTLEHERRTYERFSRWGYILPIGRIFAPLWEKKL